ncbi:HTH-type transcriptional regulator ImmR [Desulfosporosinus acididurans]|uniref:HTH-type transcriptional regulator ImmR n=1 Tax=Desulfosporosinus acididurans TaxID=476652 RepID=A0A0J1INU7_9FIRM|nr:helix-turn-helix transcriptional regulator [Desulfosporosinus acididurans]KLU66346.1 HTH-type transcriptional regulator ImmR [Desulfosporosinus acididurans]
MNQEQQKLITGKRIRLQREAKQFSQDVLAEKLNMKRSNIANYESGRVMPPGNIIKELSDIFGVSSDYLLGRSDSINQIQDKIPSGIYMRMAKEAEEMGIPEEDMELIFEMYKRFKKAND